MAENVIDLDLSRFSRSDMEKLQELGHKVRLMHRWFRCEPVPDRNGDAFAVYSGDRGPQRYAAYRIVRGGDGEYSLLDHRSGKQLAAAKSIDVVLDAIPSDFYYTS